MTNDEILSQNKAGWDAIADRWFGTTALPEYGVFMPTEDELHLFGDVCGNKVLDIGCGSGHSLKWMGDQGAAELWGLDLSARQLENAGRFFKLLNRYEYPLPNGKLFIRLDFYRL